MKTRLLITLFLCAGLLIPAQSFAHRKAKKAELPILAWYSIQPGEHSTIERYRKLKECGFNYSFVHIYSKEDAFKALDLCYKAGIKSIIMCPELESVPEETVSKVHKHPGLGGYFLRDEPHNSDWEALGKWTSRIKSEDSEPPAI